MSVEVEPRLLLSLPPALGGAGRLELVEPLAVLWRRGGVTVCEDGEVSAPVDDVLTALEQRLAAAGAGAYAVGFLGYEYGAVLDPLIAARREPRILPDAWWAVVLRHTHRRELAPPPWRRPGAGEVGVSLGDGAFRAAVERIRDGIAAGEYYQVNLTRRWTTAAPASPPALFACLCGEAPPRFATYLEDRAQGWAALCLSPELLLRQRGDAVETRPIKGTRSRGGRSPAAIAAALRASDKDRAELAMIVDLERNDLNRVCLPGSVHVARRAGVLLTRDVVHLEASVRGRLRPGVTLRELLAAVLPGGSVTGAPKIAACRAIADLEPVPRSLYCGALGIVRSGGDLALALPIRTGYVTGGALHFHSGCGIVFDSDAAAEEVESRSKVRSWLRVATVSGGHRWSALGGT